MKKTIAILLVLVIAGVGLFAAGVEGALTNTATIKVTTSVAGIALFGVSSDALVAADYADATTFTEKVSDTVTKNFTNINDLKTEQTVGYLSGFNSTNASVNLTVGISTLAHTTNMSATPLTLTVSPTVNQVVPAATTVRGILESVAIKVTGVTAEIDLAPAGSYESTITFTVATV